MYSTISPTIFYDVSPSTSCSFFKIFLATFVMSQNHANYVCAWARTTRSPQDFYIMLGMSILLLVLGVYVCSDAQSKMGDRSQDIPSIGTWEDTPEQRVVNYNNPSSPLLHCIISRAPTNNKQRSPYAKDDMPRRSRRLGGKGYNVRLSVGAPPKRSQKVDQKPEAPNEDDLFSTNTSAPSTPPSSPTVSDTSTSLTIPSPCGTPKHPWTPSISRTGVDNDDDIRVWEEALSPCANYTEYEHQRNIIMRSKELEDHLLDIRYLQKYLLNLTEDNGDMDGHFGHFNYNALTMPVHEMAVGYAPAALCASRKPNAFLELAGEDKVLYDEDLDDMIERLRMSDYGDEDDNDDADPLDWAF